MGTSFFIRRFLLVFAVATLAIGLAQYLKGHTVDYSVREALIWGAISSLVYASALAYKLRHLRAATSPKGTGGGTS